MDWRMTEPGHPSSAFPNLLSGQQLHCNFVQRICSLAKEIYVFRRKRINDNTDIQIIRMQKNTNKTTGYNYDRKQEHMTCL